MTIARMFSEWPRSFIIRVQVRGSQTRIVFSGEPLQIIVPDGFIAKL